MLQKILGNKSGLKLSLILVLGLILGILIVVAWYYTYRFEWLIRLESTKHMERSSIEGYTGRHHYNNGDTVNFHLRSVDSTGKGVLRRINGPYTYDTILKYDIPRIQQKIHKAQASKGCNWNSTMELVIPDTFRTGFYNLRLTNSRDTSDITFLISNPDQNPDVAVLAPVSTWIAYNQWGGKSLYRNGRDSSKVYNVAADRPSTALNYSRKRRKHSIHVQENIFHWFNERYNTTLLPDYKLEKMPSELTSADIIVLAYHCEYFSKPMYDNLKKIVEEKKASLISLGGNQIYWKIKWHDNFNRMECHKDLTFFEDSWSLGGMWRHNFRAEANFLGVQYTPAGIGTYAPYQVKQPEHWLFEGTDVVRNELFGQRGINQYPVCGDETDKTTFLSQWGSEVIAKGINPKHGEKYGIYTDPEATNRKGGGEIVYRSLNGHTGILATGAIQSGSGLGRDSVFSRLIKNFMNRYHDE